MTALATRIIRAGKIHSAIPTKKVVSTVLEAKEETIPRGRGTTKPPIETQISVTLVLEAIPIPRTVLMIQTTPTSTNFQALTEIQVVAITGEAGEAETFRIQDSETTTEEEGTFRAKEVLAPTTEAAKVTVREISTTIAVDLVEDGEETILTVAAEGDFKGANLSISQEVATISGAMAADGIISKIRIVRRTHHFLADAMSKEANRDSEGINKILSIRRLEGPPTESSANLARRIFRVKG